MSVMRDYRPRPEKKKEISSEGFVAWLSLIAMGMHLVSCLVTVYFIPKRVLLCLICLFALFSKLSSVRTMVPMIGMVRVTLPSTGSPRVAPPISSLRLREVADLQWWDMVTKVITHSSAYSEEYVISESVVDAIDFVSQTTLKSGRAHLCSGSG